jgi:FSR family fosmidomycin resistance protein-like MFS transporter
MSLLKDRSYLASCLAHLAVDSLAGLRAILLAVLSIPFGLSNSMIGLVSTMGTFSGSLSQPLFGLLVDHVGPRWVAAGGVIWTAVMYGLAVSIPGHGALVLLVLAGFGVAAFHPAGTMDATLIGRHHLSSRENTAASIFFLFGQVGHTIGPALAGPILDGWGPVGLLLLVVLVLPVGLNAGLRLPPREKSPAAPRSEEPVSQSGTNRVNLSLLGRIIPFVLLVALRSWAQTNLVTFLPKYFSDLGVRPGVYGPIAALFMGGSAVGGVIGGWLADRYSKRSVILWSMVLAAIPLALYPQLGTTPWVSLITVLAGALTGAPHSILVVSAQHKMPERMGSASGLVLGFTFASGALGTLLSGVQADYAGFNAVFLSSAGLVLLAALMALRIEE